MRKFLIKNLVLLVLAFLPVFIGLPGIYDVAVRLPYIGSQSYYAVLLLLAIGFGVLEIERTLLEVAITITGKDVETTVVGITRMSDALNSRLTEDGR